MARRLSSSLIMLAAGAALLVAASLARPAASVSTGAAAEARKGGTLRLSRAADVDYVDPALAFVSWSAPITFATCAKLFNYPDEPGAAGTRLIPEVVKTWTVSGDRRTYTFELRRTFHFHKGAPVTARSFADAFDRVANPRMNSPWVTFLHEIVWADAVTSGKAKTISGVRVLGRYRLQIRLTKPLGDFTHRLTLPFTCPVLPSTPIDPAGIDDPPGSGPYYVDDRVVNRRIVLKRTPTTAAADRRTSTRSCGRSARAEACRRATEQNQIDHCVETFFSNDTYRELHARYGLNRPDGQFFVVPSAATWYLAFNHDRPAFRGPGQIPLKKAINYAIDRPALARAFGYLAGRRSDQILPATLGRDERIYPLKGADPATATTWLARARLKPETLVLYTNNNPQLGGVAGAQVIVFDLKQIGIDVTVKYFEWPGPLFDRASTRGEPFDLVFAGWTADYPDPASFFVPLLHGGSLGPSRNLNLAYFNDPTTNARIDAANRLSGAARRSAWAELDSDLMRDNPPWAPVFHLLRRHFVSRSFGCFLFHPVYLVDIAAACKK